MTKINFNYLIIVFSFLLMGLWFACGQVNTSDNSTINNSLKPNTDSLKLNSLFEDSVKIKNNAVKAEYKITPKRIQYWDSYIKTEQPIVFSETAMLYSYPDTMSEVLEILKFKTSLTLVRKGFENQSNWYQVVGHGFDGFVKAENIATHSFYSNSFSYFIVTDFSPIHNPTKDGGIAIYKYNYDKKQFLDTLLINYNSGYDGIRQIYHNGWKNVDILISVTEYSHQCGGGGVEQFFVDANGKMSELISRGYWGETGDDWGESHVWLPMQTYGTKEILLIKSGDVANIFEGSPNEVKIYPFPKDINIPKNELIVFKEIEEAPLKDINGEAIENKDDTYKYKTVKNITKYFRWDGTKLVQVK